MQDRFGWLRFEMDLRSVTWTSVISVLLGSVQTVALAREENEVIISAPTQTRKSLDRAGNSIVARPEEETQFDLGTQFKLDPSIAGTDQARPLAGGFSLPLFRGQDARSSHIFLDDVELQDPFTGFPLMEDIDMRAFGELRLHRGLAPWDVSVSAPGGVVQFLSRRVIKDRFESGLIHGNIFGTSSWGELQSRGESWETKTYLRRHSANGHYSFYSDNGTIRTDDDDTIRLRDNNDRSSHLGSSSFRYEDDKNTAEAFAWVQDTDQGMPVRSAAGDGRARLRSQTSAWTTKWRRVLTKQVDLGLSAQQLFTERSFSDPAQNLSRATDQEFATTTSQGAATLRYGSTDDTLLGLLQIKQSAARVVLRSDPGASAYRPHADQTASYAGVKWQPHHVFELEVKGDMSRATSDSRTSNTWPTQKNVGLTALVRHETWTLWAQASRFERLPSLFERSGNGADFIGNDQLTAEAGVFAEVGLRSSHLAWHKWSGERALTFWAEDIRDRIRSLPISATQWKAANTSIERYRGIEMREYWRQNYVELEGAVSYTQPTTAKNHLIPRVSLWQGVFSAGFRWSDDWTLRSTSRYQGPSYDDEENTLEIADVWVHDLAIDRYKTDSWWAVGTSLLNATDVRYVRTRDVATGQGEGRIAWESKQREPLPGRQYVIRFTAKW